MVSPNAQQVFMLADYFGKLANAIGKYIDFNKGNISFEERNRLYDMEIELAQHAGAINMIGVDLVFEDVSETLSQLEVVTEGVKASVKKALAVKDAINIATNLVTIGTAIVTRDPKAIVESTIKLGKSLEEMMSE